MPAQTIRIGMGQILVEGGRPEANLDRAERALREAADAGCQVVVLPECLDLGWTDPSAATLAEPIPGPRSDRLSAAARETEILVAAGLTERAPDNVYNTALLIGTDGRLLGLHRKINLLDIEQPFYGIGDRLGVIRTPLGVVGLNICADNFRNSLALGHALGRMGARLLLSPSAWALDADHTNEQTPYDEWFEPYATLARLYDLTVIGVSNVGWIRGGPWKGKQCIGSSLAVGPGGVLLVRAPYGVEAESLTVVEAPLPPKPPKGTLLLQQLREKGYEGI